MIHYLKKNGERIGFQVLGDDLVAVTEGGGVRSMRRETARNYWAVLVATGAVRYVRNVTTLKGLDLDVFWAEARAALDGKGAECRGLDRRDRKDLGSAFISKAEYAARPEEPYLDLVVKTSRCAAGGDDWDALGTSSPSAAAMAAAKDLAAKHGLTVRWEPCEKGFGSFYFD